MPHPNYPEILHEIEFELTKFKGFAVGRDPQMGMPLLQGQGTPPFSQKIEASLREIYGLPPEAPLHNDLLKIGLCQGLFFINKEGGVSYRHVDASGHTGYRAGSKGSERIQKLRKNHSCKVNIDDELHLPTERKVLLLKIVGIRKQE